MRFGDDYREDVTLVDGTRVSLRLIQRGDSDLLAEGFRRLSAHSRFLRFMRNKEELTEQELRYLTDVDGEHHFALGAVISDPVLIERGIGIARFVRDRDKPSVAEPAVAVADEFQHRGLGTLLLARLAEAARERGIDTFRATFHEANGPLRNLLESQHVEIDQPEAGECTVLIPLGVPEAPSAANPTLGEALARLLRLAAQGVVALLGRPT